MKISLKYLLMHQTSYNELKRSQSLHNLLLFHHNYKHDVTVYLKDYKLSAPGSSFQIS